VRATRLGPRGPVGLALAGAMVAGLAIAFRPAISLAAAAAVTVLLVLRRAFPDVPLPLFVVLTVLAGGLAVPTSIAAVAEVGLVGLSGVFLLTSRRRDSSGFRIALLALAPVAWWVLLAFTHPNVPSEVVGALGVRKSTLAFVALAIGLAVAGNVRRQVAGLSMTLLAFSLLASLAVHLVWPDLEAQFNRDADFYTGTFAGEARLQGLMPGPFHVAMAGTFLALYCGISLLLRRSSERLRSAGLLGGLVLGMVCVNQTMVRSAYITLVLGGVVLLVFVARRPSGESRRSVRWTRLLVCALLIAPVAALWLADNPAVESLWTLGDDQRASARIDSLQEGRGLVAASPVVGWGPAAAGDTLGAEFVRGVHLTPHNQLLKWVLEGGVIGLVLTLIPCLIVGRLLLRSAIDRLGVMGISAALTLASFSMQGSATEAIPVTVYLALIVGSAVGETHDRDRGISNARGVQTSHGGVADARRTPHRVAVSDRD
jgi:O-antigen ligase